MLTLIRYLFRRYLLAKRVLAEGNDKQAELLFLAALDAKPTTFGASAAFLSMLRQVGAEIEGGVVCSLQYSVCQSHRSRRLRV